MARKKTDKRLPKGVYDRARPGEPANLWVTFTLTDELRAQHGLKSTSVRESAGTGDKRVAASYRARRVREAEEGTWRPVKAGGSRALTVAEHADRWCASRSDVSIGKNERQWMTDYVVPHIGQLKVDRVQKDDIKRVLDMAAATVSKRTGKKLSPRTVGHVYRAMKRMFDAAVEDRLITVSPCTLRANKNELPPNKDHAPGWRAKAIFTRAELEQLISDDRIPEYRRVLYALCFLAGLRIGEAVGRRWRDYDAEARPLGRLQVDTQLNDRDLKTENPRAVPVHPVLAKILAAWKLAGFEFQYGKRPGPEEFIVQSRNGMVRPITAWTLLQDDLERLGLRRRRIHDMRRTFISLARTDGASYLLKWVSHGAPKNVFDQYTEPTWEALCAEVAKLRVEMRSGSVVDIVKKPRAV